MKISPAAANAKGVDGLDELKVPLSPNRPPRPNVDELPYHYSNTVNQNKSSTATTPTTTTTSIVVNDAANIDGQRSSNGKGMGENGNGARTHTFCFLVPSASNFSSFAPIAC